ncbi:META and DUF4377 domain-containing protein [Acinetobacter baumannii]|uniref:META and DUF4377 domain-containing protein n=1 Tax=Acinetobacter baumannii TaxID=470 RepID=UPI00044EFD9B|nr:META and DUF4377 domain-containing protein [Acinetobacter baumannii]EXB80170.1 META domain protein [Acinetobacter baumannii 299505]MDC4808377.1 META and DUF4377 domain-containing protein [Acinetobacter baumannii]MDO7472492.1 META and DUF4377 domain-containing protein [Acinetobacter baumannii]MDV7658146.1 META and DUF4377 domain-containing protein [Acinetobacter baumannii]HAV4461959.1 META domain-containing protein [Acinetobacter baumannii]
MKIKYLILALLPFSLMACQTVSNTQAPIVSEQQQNLATTLSEYAWTYQNLKASKPLILNFNADGKLAINTGCNGQGGTWKVEGNQLVTSPLASTMMACQDDLMKQEQLSNSIFSEAKLPIEISNNNGQVILSVTDKAGQKHIFQGEKATNTQALTDYSWSYQPENTKKPIVLNFTNDRLSIDTGCNRQGTTWKVENNTIVTTDVMSTMMACEPALMKQEQFSSSLFQKRAIPFELNTTNVDQPTLTVADAQGQKYTFTGKMTPEAKYQSEGKTVFLEVAPETKSCTGVAPQTCLQVREVKYDDKGVKTYADKNWSLYYGQIEGFEHNPNQRVILRVKRFEVKNPAADQSSQADVLDMVVEQELVKKPKK